MEPLGWLFIIGVLLLNVSLIVSGLLLGGYWIIISVLGFFGSIFWLVMMYYVVVAEYGGH